MNVGGFVAKLAKSVGVEAPDVEKGTQHPVPWSTEPDPQASGFSALVAVNQLYDKMWLYYNLFQPVMRQKEKIYCPAQDGQPAHIKRRGGRERVE